jgi:hypothetical protein
LVLATGSRTIGDVPWKSSLAGYEATRDGLHKVQEQVKVAKSIVIGGAGKLDICSLECWKFKGLVGSLAGIIFSKTLICRIFAMNVISG